MNFIQKAGIGLAIAGVIAIGAFNSVFVYNEAGYQTHIRTITGEEKVVTEVGYANKFFGKATPWKQAQTLQFSIVKDGERSPEVDGGVGVDNFSVVFNGQVDATVEASTRVRMPTGEQFLAIAREYRTPENFMQTAVVPAVKETLQNTASLMTADDYFAGARSEFSSDYDDQLRNGQFVTKRKEVKRVVENGRSEGDKLISGAGDELEQKRTDFVNERVLDANGHVLRKPQQFIQLGAQIVEARITNIRPNEKFRERMVKVQNAQAELAVARADRLKEEEAKLLAIAKGQRQVEEKRQETLRDQVEQTTNAQTTKLLAITAAEQAEESATIAKRTAQELLLKAEIDAKATKTTADAEAYAKKAVMLADGALEKKLATIEVMTKYMADAIARAPVPQFSMGTGSGSRASQVEDFMSLMNAQSMKTLSLDLSTK